MSGLDYQHMFKKKRAAIALLSQQQGDFCIHSNIDQSSGNVIRK